MKSCNFSSTVKTLAVLLALILFFAGAAKAQEQISESNKITEMVCKNYIAGIKSDNLGLKRDCIYFAAVYGIKEAVKPLISEMDNVEDPSTRVLISLALYKLGEQSYLKSLPDATLADWNKKVGILSNSIVDAAKKSGADNLTSYSK